MICPQFDDHPDYFGLPLGALDDAGYPTKAPHARRQQSSWFAITDDLPQIRGQAFASAEQN